MNDNELDTYVANAFRAEGDGSESLRDRIELLSARHRSGNRRDASQLRMRMSRRFAGGLAAAVVLTSVLVIYPHIVRPISAAASVRRAIATVNTWHLKGWTVQNGRRLPMEIWGSRSPFFYREQIGSDTTLDDGGQRVNLYGHSAERNQDGGVCVMHPSLQDEKNLPWSYKFMVEQWSNAGSVWKQTAHGPIFNFNAANMDGYGVDTDHLYYIDGKTWLPSRYEKRTYRVGETARHTVGVLETEYNAAIPASARVAAAPPGYRVFNAMEPATKLPGAASGNGFTLQCQALAMDHEGNILVRLNGRLGNTPIGALQGDVHFQADVARWATPVSMDPPVNHDDKGHAYVIVKWRELDFGNPDRNTLLMLFVPREPLTADDAAPTELTARFEVSVVAGWGSLAVNLVRQDLALTVPLPTSGPAIAGAISHYTVPGHKSVISYGGYENIDASIDLARAEAYGAFRDTRKPDTPEIRRYIYWDERAIGASSALDVQSYRSELANWLLIMGKRAEARRTIDDMLHEHRFLTLRALPLGKSRDAIAAAERQLKQMNEQDYNEARAMLKSIDK